ncbi:MAG: DUF362 domain-containing protein [Desulfobacterales bacterium]
MKVTRRQFIKGVASAGVVVCGGRWVGINDASSASGKSRIFKVMQCPVHDGELRHQGVDTLLELLAENGINFYITNTDHPWGGSDGIIASDDVVLIKVNCQWKCRGTTNTDVVCGLIYRILQHPDGFDGEVVIFENGQGRGGFDGLKQGGSAYDAWPDIADGICINAEDENLLTVDYLVYTVFKNDPVSSYLLDPIRSVFISNSDHITNGYRSVSDVSYPCFTSDGGNRIELYEGIWNGSAHNQKLKLINLPVSKHHGGTGITGVLKHSYGILSMSDGNSGIRHYSESGIQCGKMWSLVKVPDLNILDCIWVSPNSLSGYPRKTTYRANTLLAGIDPVAMDYYMSKHILYPIGGTYDSEHHPDSFSGLINHLSGARDFINGNGGIDGEDVRLGDENIEVLSASAGGSDPGGWGIDNIANDDQNDVQTGDSGGSGGSGGGACFISTLAD